MLNLMPIPHVLHMKEIIPMSRRTNDCCADMVTGGPDVPNNHARCSKLAMAENHIKTDSIGLQLQNVGMSRRNYQKHDAAPLSLYKRSTIAQCSMFDHKNRGQKTPPKRR